MRPCRLLALLVALELCSTLDTGFAQEHSDADRVAPKSSDVSSDSVTAEDLLRALRRQRPAGEVIAPASRAGKPEPVNRRTLRPEGATIVESSGSLAISGAWWMFQPLCDTPCPALKVLPNARLEMMVRTLEGAGTPVGFLVSAEVTVFEGENYLLIKHAARVASPVEHSSAPGPASADSVASNAPAEDVLGTLRALKPDQAVLPEGRQEGASTLGKVAALGGAILLDGTPLMNRPGRLVREGAWWTLSFESDRRESAEPPMRLLPNQALELMVQSSKSGEIGLSFVVSGEATLFDGSNYFLARSVTRQIDLGNLRK